MPPSRTDHDDDIRAVAMARASAAPTVLGPLDPSEELEELHPLESLVRASTPAAQAFDARCDSLGPDACFSLCVAVMFGLRAPADTTTTTDE